MEGGGGVEEGVKVGGGSEGGGRGVARGSCSRLLYFLYEMI